MAALLESAWLFLTSHFSDFQLATLGTFIVHESVFFLSGLPSIIFERSGIFSRYKIQNKKNPPASHEKCITRLILFHVCVNLPIMLVSYPAFKYMGMKSSLPLPDWRSVLFQIAFYFILEDFVFYWGHRVLHTKWLYKHVHSVHHEYATPFGLASEYAHPAEILFLGFATVIGPALTGPHLLTMWLWVVLRVLETPLSHSSYLRLQVLREIFWDVDDKLHCLVNLSLSDLKAFIPNLLYQMHIEGLCHGNLSEDEAISIANIFRSIFSVQPLRPKCMHQERILRLPHGASFSRSVCVKNEHEMNSVVELYFQIEQDIGTEATKLRAITDFFGNIIEEPCFNQLRTKEQLGYTVDCGPRMTYRVLGFCFQVQSSKYNPVYVHGRINNFINGLQEYLDGLDDESFENHRNGLIAQKLEKDPSLTDETGHYWTQIVDKRYLFDINKLEAEELKTIQKNDLINWYNTYLRPESPKCRQLAVHVWGCDTNFAEESKKQEKFVEIDDLHSLKTTSEFYSSLC